jgi:hypothetical protein
MISGAVAQAMTDLEEPVGIGDGERRNTPSLPRTYVLGQNYPNPFNPETAIRYSLPERRRVTLAVYNILGQRVKTLVNKEQKAGYYTFHWNGKDDYGREVSSGVYLYKLEAGKFSQTRKMLLLK